MSGDASTNVRHPVTEHTRTPDATPTERLASLDLLRGLALLGIVLVNARMIAWPPSAFFLGKTTPNATVADRWADMLLESFLLARVYPLFALLFGAGVGFMILRGETHGTPTRSTLWLRYLVLLLLGVIHGTLIWQGDILTSHAVVGFVLLLTADWSRRALLGTSAALCALTFALMASVLAFTVFVLPHEPELLREHMAELRTAFDEESQVLAHGTWRELYAFRRTEWLRGTLEGVLTLPLFLFSGVVGFVLTRGGSVARARHAPAPWRRAARLGLGFSAAVSALLLGGFARGGPGPLGGTQRALLMLQDLSGPVLAISLFSLAVVTPSLGLGRSGRALAAMGRLSLTHYLSQSVILTALFSGWGLGLGTRLGTSGVVLVAASLWTVQLLVSAPWLAHFHLGPMEWLWRSLSNLERQPFVRRRELAPSDATAA